MKLKLRIYPDAHITTLFHYQKNSKSSLTRGLSGFTRSFGTTAANQGFIFLILQLCAENHSIAVIKEDWQKK